MPSDKKAHGRRTQIYAWRAKIGNADVFSSAKKSDVVEWIRRYTGPGKPRLVAPNMGRQSCH